MITSETKVLIALSKLAPPYRYAYYISNVMKMEYNYLLRTLKSLEFNGSITSENGQSKGTRRKKFYTLTGKENIDQLQTIFTENEQLKEKQAQENKIKIENIEKEINNACLNCLDPHASKYHTFAKGRVCTACFLISDKQQRSIWNETTT